jgi:predicted O-methyltransferase YrrM
MMVSSGTNDGDIPKNYINDFKIPWSMSKAEQSVLIQLLQQIKPKVSIEIGTYNGGSLQALSAYSEQVYAIDLMPKYRDERCDAFNNVDYLIGDSKTIVPELVDKLNNSNDTVEFVLIDGDHSSQGVLDDITNILKLVPKQPIVIILHDSFNPNCRKGIKAYNYNSNNYVHAVELDYVTGLFNHDGLYREMWGGFAAIFMKPEKRTKSLTVKAYQEKLYKITYYKSIHFYRKLFWFLKPIYKVFKK